MDTYKISDTKLQLTKIFFPKPNNIGSQCKKNINWQNSREKLKNPHHGRGL